MRFTRSFDYLSGKSRIVYLLLTLLWVAVIFSFSLQPASTSSQMSRGVGHWLVETFAPTFAEQLATMRVEKLELLHTLLRKAGHFSEYFILGILASLTALQTKLRYRKLSALSFCVLVAAIDETIQLFVSGRSGQVSDVVLDGVGALCGMAVLMGVRNLYFHLKTIN